MPIALYVLFALSLLPLVLAWISGYFRYKELGSIDNHHPRLQQNKLTNIGARAVAAQHNSWEALQLFTASLFIAFASDLDLHTLTTASLLFLAFRVAYLVCYLANWSMLRSTFYAAALACCVYIFYLSVTHFSGM